MAEGTPTPFHIPRTESSPILTPPMPLANNLFNPYQSEFDLHLRRMFTQPRYPLNFGPAHLMPPYDPFLRIRPQSPSPPPPPRTSPLQSPIYTPSRWLPMLQGAPLYTSPAPLPLPPLFTTPRLPTPPPALLPMPATLQGPVTFDMKPIPVFRPNKRSNSL